MWLRSVDRQPQGTADHAGPDRQRVDQREKLGDDAASDARRSESDTRLDKRGPESDHGYAERVSPGPPGRIPPAEYR